VKEGQPYTVVGVQLEGEYLGKEEEFKALVSIRPGDPYPRRGRRRHDEGIRPEVRHLRLRVREGRRVPQIDRANAQVTLVLGADPQRRVYVRRINVAGNTRTRDEVVRREFRQFESSWYDGNRIKLSRDRVDRLGFFSEVSVDSNEVPARSIRWT
jgi:outer membrane protein insertion porin family